MALILSTAPAFGTTACSSNDPHPAQTRSESMSRAGSKAAVDQVYGIVARAVGGDAWSAEATWLDCTTIGGPDRAQYSFTASRRTPLTAGPDAAMENVRDELRAAGFDVTVQKDRAAGSTAIGYPEGFNGGTAEDGSGWEVIARESGIAFSGTGRCVPGVVPVHGDPLNNAPTPSAAP